MHECNGRCNECTGCSGKSGRSVPFFAEIRTKLISDSAIARTKAEREESESNAWWIPAIERRLAGGA